MKLPDPPFFEQLLFERPWPVILILVLFTVAFLFSRRTNLSRNTLICSGMMITVALAIFLTSRVVTTDREQIIAASQKLVKDIENGDVKALRKTIDSHAIFSGPRGDKWFTGEEVFQMFSQITQNLQMENNLTGEIQSQFIPASNGKSLINVQSKTDQYKFNAHTRWLITWRRDRDGAWHALELQWLRVNGRNPSRDLWFAVMRNSRNP